MDDLERKTSHSDHSQKAEDQVVVTFTRDEELRLLRKFDFSILPPLAFMTDAFMQPGNVGNAKTDGWDKDIHLVGNQYFLLVMIFYVPFCLFGTPISLFVKRYSAARVLPLMMIGFGSMALFAGIAKNFSQIFAIRFFLGIFESAMLPAVVYYLSTFYKRNELASRVGVFYAAASIAGAFSGLIAFGVFHINSPHYHSWQFLFWIEGGGTILFATFAFFWLPRAPATWSFLTERQKEIARARILNDSLVEIGEATNIVDAFRPFKSPLYWVWMLISVPLASVNNFLPQIIASFQYSTVKTNLFTVAPNVVGTVALLVLTFSSDYFRERTIRELTLFLSGAIDTLKHLHVAYFACFMITMGAFAPSVLVASWYSNNTNQESRRAVVAAVMVAFANSAGLISTNVFRAQDAPKYAPALATSAAFGGLCLILVAGTGIWMRWENAKRNRVQGVNLTSADVPTSVLAEGPASPSFRYMY
ncbi:major facilitator superfamily domain-containing protein [Roridomyces roridus]|uniref:Major facilitator superfamily domain-containing protein n=1 Tax=Roridomyces roridus TaxID=1738132 RepID=A0AAD7BUB4_9AGAR|nr:major facilitator superfamily domain-containing protein [Roridomyces roridus]